MSQDVKKVTVEGIKLLEKVNFGYEKGIGQRKLSQGVKPETVHHCTLHTWKLCS